MSRCRLAKSAARTDGAISVFLLISSYVVLAKVKFNRKVHKDLRKVRKVFFKKIKLR
jgi:hypothetical protein